MRAHRVEVLSLQFDGADPAVADMVSTYGPRLASQALEAFALYHVKPEELQLADSLGLQTRRHHRDPAGAGRGHRRQGRGGQALRP